MLLQKSCSHFPYDSEDDAEFQYPGEFSNIDEPAAVLPSQNVILNPNVQSGSGTNNNTVSTASSSSKSNSKNQSKNKGPVQQVLPFTVNGKQIEHCVIHPQQTRKKTSPIWHFFQKSVHDPRYNTCNICSKEVSNANTTNCTSHLNQDHRKAYTNFLKQLKVVNDSSPSVTENESETDIETAGKISEETLTGGNVGVALLPVVNPNLNKNSKSFKDTSTRTNTKQQSIRNILKRKRKSYKDKSAKKRKLDESLTKMICRCLLPFNIVEKPAFQQFVSTLDDRYVLPCREKVSTTLLTNLHRSVQEKVNNLLNLTKGYMTITFDGWRSRSNDDYLAVTAHFIDGSWKLCSFLIKLINCNDISHTAEDLAAAIRNDVLCKIQSLVCFAAVTDCAANMIATTEKLGLKHSPCVAHRMQSVIHAALLKSNTNLNDTSDAVTTRILGMDPEELTRSITAFEDAEGASSAGEQVDLNSQTSTSVAIIIRKCKRITKGFNQSTKLSKTLKKDLQLKKSSVTSLVQECPTRWNTTFFMLQRFLLVLDSVNVVLGRVNHNFEILTPIEVTIIPDIVSCLDCFQIATNDLSGSSYPSISLVIPTVTTLLSELKECQTSTCKTAIGKQFAIDLEKFTKSILLKYEERTCSALACLLDPRFKKGPFYNPKNADNATVQLRNEVKTLIEMDSAHAKTSAEAAPLQTNNMSSPSSDSMPKPKTKGLLKMIKNIMPATKKSASQVKLNTSMATASIHVNEYLSEDVIQDLNACPLSYWEKHPSPYLKELARKYLCVPGTSVPSEATFSTAGDTVTPSRNRISPEKVDKIVYINKNSKFFDDDKDNDN